MSSRYCPKCGRQYSSSYQKCPYCSGQAKRRRPQSTNQLDQILAILQEHGPTVFTAFCGLLLVVAILAALLTRCSGTKPEDDQVPPEPAETEQDPVEPLVLSQTAVSITVGETVTLSVSGQHDALTWKSSNEEIASVENGTVTAKAAGAATISVSAGTESVSCQVTVLEAVPVVHLDLALNHKDFTLPAGDPPVQMKVKISGTKDLYDGTIVWASQDTSVVTISAEGLVERVGRGTTTITASADGQVLECIVRVP